VNVEAETHYRLIDRYVVHGGCEPLLGRIEEIIPREAHYVVLDLDGTVHVVVTIGERLGWEIVDGASRATRADGDEIAPMFAARRPWHSSRNFAIGLRQWGLPGLVYAATVRLGGRWESWDNLLSVRFMGSRYVERVQELLRGVLMSAAAGLSREQLAAYAQRAWRRYEDRLVVTPEVVEAIRRACPRLRKVLLSSASTSPTVEHAAQTLGADGFVASSVDLYDDDGTPVYSAPVDLPALFRVRRPRFFSRPGAVLHNAAERKVSLLRMRYPEVFASGVVSVGISDNNYGEDRSWSDHFRHVVALNSRYPFSPFVSRPSPCESIHSVDARPSGGAQWQASAGRLGDCEHDRETLSRMLGGEELTRLEGLRGQLRSARAAAAAAREVLPRSVLASIVSRLTEAVEEYNVAATAHKAALGREVHALSRRLRRLRVRLGPLERSCHRVLHEIDLLHSRAARAVVERSR